MIVDFGLKDKRRGRVLKNNNPADANLSFFWRKRSHKSGIVAGKYRDSLRRPPEGQSHRSTLRPVPATMPEYRRRDRKGGKLIGGSGRTEETLDPFPENPRPFSRKPSTLFPKTLDPFSKNPRPFSPKTLDPFSKNPRPFSRKPSTLFPENPRPFFQKPSTLFPKTLDPFSENPRPFSRKPSTLFPKTLDPFLGSLRPIPYLCHTH